MEDKLQGKTVIVKCLKCGDRQQRRENLSSFIRCVKCSSSAIVFDKMVERICETCGHSETILAGISTVAYHQSGHFDVLLRIYDGPKEEGSLDLDEEDEEIILDLDKEDSNTLAPLPPAEDVEEGEGNGLAPLPPNGIISTEETEEDGTEKAAAEKAAAEKAAAEKAGKKKAPAKFLTKGQLPNKKMTVGQLKKELDHLKIPYKKSLKKDALYRILYAAKKKEKTAKRSLLT